ncbi:MAG: dephospho-CoA kinase [Devosia sp.]
MWKVGLTGSIATGKSTALKLFAEMGIPVFSSDDAVHDLYRGAAVAPVGAAFPGVVIDGAVDRAALGQATLGDSQKLRQLEAIVHPLVRAQIADFLAAAESRGEPIAVVDIPLLFESGYDYGLDRVAVTLVDAATQRERALARPGMNVEKLEAILARQMPQAEKRLRADYIIETSGPIARTREAVTALVAALRANPKGS